VILLKTDLEKRQKFSHVVFNCSMLLFAIAMLLEHCVDLTGCSHWVAATLSLFIGFSTGLVITASLFYVYLTCGRLRRPE